MRAPLGHIHTYYDASQPKFTDLGASILAYAHINLLSMLSRFASDEAVWVATNSIYVRKSALKKLRGVEAFMGKKKCNCSGIMCSPSLLREECLSAVAPGQWRDKGEELYMPMDHAAFFAKPDYIANTIKDLSPSTARTTTTRLSYLNSGRIWIIDDFLQRSNLAYLAVSRLEFLVKLERVVCTPRMRVSLRHVASLPRSQRSSSAKSSRPSW